MKVWRAATNAIAFTAITILSSLKCFISLGSLKDLLAPLTKKQHKCSVRKKIADPEPVNLPHLFNAKFARAALIGE